LEIDGWLRGIGLAQYTDIFRANDIDGELLSGLTNDDLKDIGVASLGHRRKLMEAIADLAGAVLASPLPALSEAKAQDSAERRQVTVMFSDLVGSTALAASMDPEDLREIISAYQKSVAETVHRFGGFVAKYMGDGVLIYFGYPQAHEDDAERAVRAGLELIEAVTRLKTRASLQTRVGIATGLVVVGDLTGSGEAQERGIVGETPNLAARLQGIAEPNTVVIAEGTRKLLGNLFELQDLGTRDLKGIAGPLRAWAALRASSAEGRFEALHATRLTTLIGREEETELLLRRWSRVKTGEGQVVLLSGEAGIGKSRLTAALLEQIATEPHTRLRYFCSSQHSDSALYPIIGQMERAAGLTYEDAPRTKLDKLDAMLAQTTTSAQDAALFAEMMSLPNDGRYPALNLAPEQRRQRTLEALTAQLAGLAGQRPVLMIVEDVHWIDPTSLEVFGRTVDRVKTLPVLLIVTFRPEFNAPWTGQSHVMSLALNRLGEREAAAIVAHLVGNKELPAEVMAEIVERTDGIPLFVEEMTKAVLEAGSEEAGRGIAGAIPSTALAVPASLHASLMSRLDRLGAAKEVAQIGAAIGREFSHALLAAVIRKRETELGSALDRLIAAGLLFPQGVPPHATYLFKHALVQDAAYGTLLRERRRQLHADIAAAIESHFPETLHEQPELIAMHLLNAERREDALPHIVAAARFFKSRYSYVEAIRWFERGAQIIRALPPNDRNQRFELDLYVEWAPISMTINGYTDPRTMAIAQHADALCRQFGETDRLLHALFPQVSFYGAGGGSLEKGLEYTARIIELGEETTDPVALMIGHRFAGFFLLWLGRFNEAAAALDQALDYASRVSSDGLAGRFGHDPETTAMVLLGSAKQLLGSVDDGERLMQTAAAKARMLGHPLTLAYVLRHYTVFACLQKNYSLVDTLSDELSGICRKYQIRQWYNLGPLMAVWSRFQSRQDSDAIPALLASLAQHRDTGFRRNMPFYLMLVADVLANSRCVDQAKELIDEACSLMRETNEAWIEPYLLEMAGRVNALAGE
jgi:class 3 adenylate cyclase/tetratricopeptide (TPR) repeat protein